MPNVVYRFQSMDAPAVVRDFQSIGAAAQASKQAMTQVRERRGASASPEAQAAKESIRAQRDAVAAAKAADRAKLATARATAKELAKIERQKTTDAKAEMRSRDRAEKEHGRQLSKFYASEAKQRHRETVKYERARMRDMKSLERQRGLGREAGATALFGGAAGALAGGGLALASTIQSVVGPAVRGDLDAKTLAKKLGTSGRGAGQKAVDPDRLLQEAYAAAATVPGTTAEQILQAQSEYTARTGDLDSARKFGGMFATTAKASDASLSDVASTAAAVSQTFGIKDQKGMQDALGALVMGGRAGAFEFSDLGANFGEMAAAGSRFGLDKGASGVKTLGGLAQIARMSTGSGSEASTAVQAMMSQLLAKGADTGDKGVAALTGGKKVGGKWRGGAQVFTDDSHTKARPIEDVLVDVIAGAKGDISKLGDVFDIRGIKGASKLVEKYNEAGGGEAGKEAMRALMASMMNAGGDWKDIEKDAAANVGADDQVTSFQEKMKSTFGDAFTPFLETAAEHMNVALEPMQAFAEALAVSIDSLAELSQFISEKFNIGGGSGVKRSDNVFGELASTNREIGELDAIKASSGGLTLEQKRKKRTLESRRVELRQQALEGPEQDELTKKLLANGIDIENTPQYGAALGGGPVETEATKEARESHETRSRLLGTAGQFAGQFLGGSVLGGSFGFGAGASIPTVNDASDASAERTSKSFDAASSNVATFAADIAAASEALKQMKVPIHMMPGPPGSP